MSPELSDEQGASGRSDMLDFNESLFGPRTAEFTLNRAATTGEHPEAILLAWVGVPLPIRAAFAERKDKKVQVLCSDGFNALVEAGASETVLQYWVDLLDGRAGPEATFVFSEDDGTYAEV